jgi:hypothetical protein
MLQVLEDQLLAMRGNTTNAAQEEAITKVAALEDTIAGQAAANIGLQAKIKSLQAQLATTQAQLAAMGVADIFAVIRDAQDATSQAEVSQRMSELQMLSVCPPCGSCCAPHCSQCVRLAIRQRCSCCSAL